MSNNAVRRGQPSSPNSNRRPSHGHFVSRIPTYTPVGGSTQVLEQVQEMSDYPWLFTQPFADPLETLCHAYGLEKATTQLSAGHEVPHTINIPFLDEVSQDLHYLDEPPPTPTHALVIVSNDPNASSPPIIAPINDIAFSTTFTYDITRQYPRSNDDPPPPAPTPPDSEREILPPPPPIEIANGSEERQTIVLPTVVLAAAHPPSVPVVLLFAMAPFLPAMYRPPLSLPPSHVTTPFHSRSPTLSPASTPPLSPAATPPPSPPPPIRRFLPPPQYPIPPGLFPTYLLPTFVIEELPGYPTAVNMMARNCTWEELDAWAAYSFGVWGNLLVLNPKSDELRVHVQLSMKLTSDARKTRRYLDVRRAEAKAKAKAAARET